VGVTCKSSLYNYRTQDMSLILMILERGLICSGVHINDTVKHGDCEIRRVKYYCSNISVELIQNRQYCTRYPCQCHQKDKRRRHKFIDFLLPIGFRKNTAYSIGPYYNFYHCKHCNLKKNIVW
jgi:hypothetical protein